MSAQFQSSARAPQNVDSYLGRRVVLTCRGELSFCGVARRVLEVGARRGVLLETDPRSGFSVWCPLDYIKSVTVIPIPVEEPDAPSWEGSHDSYRLV